MAAVITPVQVAKPAVEIDGRFNAVLTASMLRLDISDSEDGLAHCELLFGNWGGAEKSGFQHFDRSQIEFGKKITVKLADEHLFEGRISAINAIFPDGSPAQIGIYAEDYLQDLRMTRRTRCFADATLGDVVQRIASDHGLEVQADLNGTTHKILAQMNQSDLAFLRDLARAEDAQIWFDGTKLRAATRTQRNDSIVELAWAGNLSDEPTSAEVGRLLEFRVSADLAHQRTSLVASGWEVGSKELARYEANESAVRSEFNQGDSGIKILGDTFGNRTDTLAHGAPCNTEEARTLAEASLRHLARRFVVGHGIAETQANLRVGVKLKLTGLGPLFEGDYTLTFVRHRFDQSSGIRTEFRCDRPFLGG